MNTMPILVSYTFILFLIAYAAGRRWPALRLWGAIDIVYYPVAAVGVLLFFASRDLQRDLLRTTQEAERARSSLMILKSQQPNAAPSVSEIVFDAHFQHLDIFDEWAKICPTAFQADPVKCSLTEDLQPHLAKFRQATRRKFNSFDERALATCSAAEAMSKSILSDSSMSFMPSTNLRELFSILSSKTASYAYNPDFLDSSVKSYISKAKQSTREALKQVYNAGDSKGRLFHLAMSDEAAEQGALIARAFYPCFVLPMENIKRFHDWSNQAQKQTEKALALERQRARLKDQPFRNYLASWAELHVWPFVVNLALSLKFAKGVAAWSKK